MRKYSLSKKMILIFFLSTLIMLLSLTMLYRFTYDRAIKQQSLLYSQESLLSTTTMLADHFTDLTASASSLAMKEDIRDFLSGDANARFNVYRYVQNDISSYISYKKGVLEIYLLSKNGTRLSSNGQNTQLSSNENLQLLLLTQELFDYTQPFRKAFFTPILNCRQESTYFSLVVPVFESVVAPRDQDYLGCIVILLSAEQSSSLIPVTSRSKLLITQDTIPVYNGNSDLMTAWLDSNKRMPAQYGMHQVLTDHIDCVDWTVFYLAISDTVEAQYQDLRNFCFSFGAVLVILQVLSLLFF